MSKYAKRYLRTLKPVDVRAMTTKEMRKMYSTLRSTANKRVTRLKSKGMGQEVDFFKTLKHIASGDLPSLLIDVARFVGSEKNTVRGRKREYENMVNMLEEKGYEGVIKNYDDFYKFTKYMEGVRERVSSKLYDSGDALDVFEQGQRLNIPFDKLLDNYDAFAENLDSLEMVRPSKNGREFTQARINALLKKWDK